MSSENNLAAMKSLHFHIKTINCFQLLPKAHKATFHDRNQPAKLDTFFSVNYNVLSQSSNRPTTERA